MNDRREEVLSPIRGAYCREGVFVRQKPWPKRRSTSEQRHTTVSVRRGATEERTSASRMHIASRASRPPVNRGLSVRVSPGFKALLRQRPFAPQVREFLDFVAEKIAGQIWEENSGESPEHPTKRRGQSDGSTG